MRLILIVLVIAAAGYIGYRFGRPPGAPASTPVVTPAALSRTPPTPSGQQTLPVTRSGPTEVSVVVTEAELSRLLSDKIVGQPIGNTPLGNATVERVQVALRHGQAETAGAARLAGASVPFTSTMTAAPDPAGRVQLKIRDATLAGLELPDLARAGLEQVLQQQLDQLLASQPIRVRSIEIGDGRLRATGSPRA